MNSMMFKILAILVIFKVCFGSGDISKIRLPHPLFFKWRDNLSSMLESPPDVWSRVESTVAETVLKSFPEYTCDGVLVSFTMEYKCEHASGGVISNRYTPGLYYDMRFLCGKRQPTQWKHDGLTDSNLFLQRRGIYGSCVKNGCYSYCLENGKQPKCDAGFTLVDVKDACIDENESYYENFVPKSCTGYTKEFMATQMYEVQCCEENDIRSNCNELEKYSKARLQFECLDEDYTGVCTTEIYSLVWIAAMYCGDSERSFLCCCNSECYWTKCESEPEIDKREVRHLQDNYDCGNENSGLCEIYSKFLSYYDAYKFCLDDGIDYNKEVLGMPKGFLNYFKDDIYKYDASCVAIGISSNVNRQIFREIFKNSHQPHNHNPNQIGLNAAGLKALSRPEDQDEGVLDSVDPHWKKLKKDGSSTPHYLDVIPDGLERLTMPDK